MIGYVKQHRQMFDHHLFRGQKFCRGYAWAWMVASAAHTECEIDAKGKTVVLKRGQFSHSIRFMADVWGWDKAAVSRFIDRLKTETMIETATETGQLVVTICNYSKYQGEDTEAETAKDTPSETRARQQRDSSETNNKNDKNDKKIIDSPDGESLPLDLPPPKKPDKAFLPRDWVPEDSDVAYALSQNLTEAEIKEIADDYAGYWSDRRDAKAKRTSDGWRRTWQQWVRKAAPDYLRSRATRSGRGTSLADAAMRNRLEAPDRRAVPERGDQRPSDRMLRLAFGGSQPG